eukprot:COSAG05_NODE_361_length_10793_cov_141.983262_9_plen_64_part_00
MNAHKNACFANLCSDGLVWGFQPGTQDEKGGDDSPDLESAHDEDEEDLLLLTDRVQVTLSPPA